MGGEGGEGATVPAAAASGEADEEERRKQKQQQRVEQPPSAEVPSMEEQQRRWRDLQQRLRPELRDASEQPGQAPMAVEAPSRPAAPPMATLPAMQPQPLLLLEQPQPLLPLEQLQPPPQAPVQPLPDKQPKLEPLLMLQSSPPSSSELKVVSLILFRSCFA